MTRPDIRMARARQSLNGLSVGDAFGQQLFLSNVPPEGGADLPPGPWPWTDDTHMALSIVQVLDRFATIDQDALAQLFAHRFWEEPHRGYGGGAFRLLRDISDGGDWRRLAPTIFPGGSMGNGSAMRVGPVGAYFAGDMQRVVAEANASAEVTHAHPEGRAGAIAIAVAAALATRRPLPAARDFIHEVAQHVPEGETRSGIVRALDLDGRDVEEVGALLGTGSRVTAPDTVPFCVWCAAHHLRDYERALWVTVRPFGDRDTTCAIVGSIVALSSESIPSHWIDQREPLPVYGVEMARPGGFEPPTF